MQSLSAHDVLEIWEHGRHQTSTGRALTALQHAFPGMARESLVALSIGQRDAWLFRLRRNTIGSSMTGFAVCPECSEQLEFDLGTAQFDVLPCAASASGLTPVDSVTIEATIAGRAVTFRLPNSGDLEAVAGCAEARRRLAQRCLLAVEADGAKTADDSTAADLTVENLTRELIEGLAAEIERRDPGADIVLDLRCVGCDHSWQTPLDIASFFWEELATHARRLLGEVHILAREYGWEEREILAMSQTRRTRYLEMILT